MSEGSSNDGVEWTPEKLWITSVINVAVSTKIKVSKKEDVLSNFPRDVD